MLNTPYTRNDRTYANDLKIFMGKRMEIAQLEAANKLVDKKWYLAWDTGEFFIANSMRKLVRYGGSANNLSKEDIEKIISNYTAHDLEIIRAQLVDILDYYNNTKNEIIELNAKFDSTIQHLENETETILINKINDILNNSQILDVYTKTQVNDIVEASEYNVKEFVQNNYVDSSILSDYMTKTESAELVSNKLTFNSGNNLDKLLSIQNSGYYFCTSDSLSNKFETGHTYYLHNGNYEDITAAGSGSGYLSPMISLTLNGQTKIIKEICSDFVDDLRFEYSITNFKDLRGTLSFYENKNKIDSIVLNPSLNGDFHYTATLTNLNVGEYNYTLSGLDKKNNLVKSDVILKVIAPIYFGNTQNMMPSSDAILASNKKLSDIATGRYTFSTKTGDYIFIAIPENLNIQRVSMNGFDIPMTSGEKVIMKFGDYTIMYNYYRSKTSTSAETFTVDVI